MISENSLEPQGCNSCENSFWSRLTSNNVIVILVTVLIIAIIYGAVMVAQAGGIKEIMKSSYFSDAFWNTCHFWFWFTFGLVSELTFWDALIVMVVWELIEYLMHLIGFVVFKESMWLKVCNVTAGILGFIAGRESSYFLCKDQIAPKYGGVFGFAS